jgi:hypothetical protein
MNKKQITTTATEITRKCNDLQATYVQLVNATAERDELNAKVDELTAILAEAVEADGTEIGRTEKSVFTGLRFLVNHTFRFFVKRSTTSKGTIDYRKAFEALAKADGMTASAMAEYAEQFRRNSTTSTSYRTDLTDDERKAMHL